MELTLFDQFSYYHRLALEYVISIKGDDDISGTLSYNFRIKKKDIVRSLLTVSFDTEAIIPTHGTTLLHAIVAEYIQHHRRGVHDINFAVEVIRTLLEKGANPNVLQSNGKSLISYIIDIKSIELMVVVLPYFDITMQDSGGATLLHYALEKEFIAGLRILVQDPRCMIDIQDSCNISPLMLATRRSLYEAQVILLEAGAQQLADYTENTPLHVAVSFVEQHVVECMLKHGAPLDMKNAQGKTPLDFFPDVYEHLCTIAPETLDETQKQVIGIMRALEKEKERRAFLALFPSTTEKFLHIKQSENRLCSFLCLLNETGFTCLPLS